MSSLRGKRLIISAALAASSFVLVPSGSALATMPGDNGRIVQAAGYDVGELALIRSFRPNGSRTKIIVRDPGIDVWGGISVSADGRRVAYATKQGGNTDIYVARLDRSRAPRNLTPDSDANEWNPAFGPAAELVFSSDRKGKADVYFRRRAGAVRARNLTAAQPLPATRPTFSPQGDRIAYMEGTLNSASAIAIVDPYEAGDHATLTENDRSDSPDFSPAGDRILYRHTDYPGDMWAGSSDPQVFKTIDLDGSNPMALTGQQEGIWRPTFSPDGQMLLHMTYGGFGLDVVTVTEIETGQYHFVAADRPSRWLSHYENNGPAVWAPRAKP